MRKSLEIRDETTIMKFEAIQTTLNLSAPQILDMALNSLIVSISEKQKMDSIIHTFITQSPTPVNVSVVSKAIEINSKVL